MSHEVKRCSLLLSFLQTSVLVCGSRWLQLKRPPSPGSPPPPICTYISHFVRKEHKGGTLGQLKLSTRRPNSGRCRPQTTSARNDVPRLAAHLLRPTTCPTPSRGRKEEARATTSGTRGRRACGGTTSRTNRTSAERRVSRAPAAATPTPSAADGGRESTRRGATRPSPSRLPPAAPRGVGCTALRDGPGGGERPLPPAWRTISPVEASL